MKTAYEHLSCTRKNNENPRPLGLHTHRVSKFLVRTSRDAFNFVLCCTILLYMRPALLVVLLVTTLSHTHRAKYSGYLQRFSSLLHPFNYCQEVCCA